MYPLGMAPQDPLIFALCTAVIFCNGLPLAEYLSQEQKGSQGTSILIIVLTN